MLGETQTVMNWAVLNSSGKALRWFILSLLVLFVSPAGENAAPASPEFKVVGNESARTGTTTSLTWRPVLSPGTSVTLPSLYIWHKDGKPIASQTDQTLTLYNVAAEDEGFYQCGGPGDFMSGEGLHLHVTDLENITLTSDLVVNERNSVTLTCGVDSHPTARLTWTVNGQEVRHVTDIVDHYVILSAACSDSNNYTCGASNPDLPGLEIHATVQLTVLCNQKVSSLKQSCSYSSADRTVRCDGVTSEVRIYRIGKQSDRDIRYFSSPFHFQLGEREAGTYRVALVEASADGGIHSDVFEFHVDKPTRVANGELNFRPILGVVTPLSILLILLLACIRHRRAGLERTEATQDLKKNGKISHKSETSENVPLTSISSQHRDQEQQWPNMNGQHSVPTEPFSEDSDAQA